MLILPQIHEFMVEVAKKGLEKYKENGPNVKHPYLEYKDYRPKPDGRREE